jgi:hypothetical protein
METFRLSDNVPKAVVERLQAMGLSPERIARHAERLARVEADPGARPVFAVADTCRLDNGAVLPADAASRIDPERTDRGSAAGSYVAFVPAAGAASRYSRPLQGVIEALEAGNTAAVPAKLAELNAEGARAWPMPPRLSALLADPAAGGRLDAAARRELLADLELPKALLPCVAEGDSFLAMKVREHEQIPEVVGEVYVAPQGSADAFARALAAAESAPSGKRPVPKPVVMEQGASLSTVRFRPNGELWLDPQGQPSPVPAGHGELARLFPDVLARFPKMDGLFIRNIDNVMGTWPNAVAATQAFLEFHAKVLAAVRGVRAGLAQNDVAGAAKHVKALLMLVPTPTKYSTPMEERTASRPATEQPLWQLQARLFHTPLLGEPTLDLLRSLYARPVNLLGQVPNTGKDVGGTPCFVRARGAAAPSADGGAAPLVKVCLEVPHVSESDKRDYFANPARATHFNPVFAAVEATHDPDQYAREAGDFWLLAEKTHRGQPVRYYETVLYELIGNSTLANCAFIEVPRFLFNPHKALADAMGRSRAAWLGGRAASSH